VLSGRKTLCFKQIYLLRNDDAAARNDSSKFSHNSNKTAALGAAVAANAWDNEIKL